MSKLRIIKTNAYPGVIVDNMNGFVAFVPSDDGLCFTQVHDFGKAISTPGVVLTESLDEAHDEIRKLFGEDLSWPASGLDIGSTCSRAVQKNYQVLTHTDAFKIKKEISVKDVPKVVEFIRGHGPIQIGGGGSELGRRIESKWDGSEKSQAKTYEARQSLWDQGIHIDLNNGCGPIILTLDKVKAKKQMAGQKSAIKKTFKTYKIKYARSMDLSYFLGGLHVKATIYGGRWSGDYAVREKYRRNHADQSLEPYIFGVELFNALYGKNAHRKLSGFQDLIKKWRCSSEKRKKKVASEELVTWLDHEATFKLNKPKEEFEIRKGGVVDSFKQLLKTKKELNQDGPTNDIVTPG